MRLVERGIIDINDPVSKYIPEFANMTVKDKDGIITPATEEMRIVHLFTMTGGLDYDIKAPHLVNAEDKSTLGLVRAMASVPLHFEPGTRYKYSLCHDVLAAVVEIASGMRYYDYLKENIFDPLGIVDMGFRPNDEQKARFSAMYSYRSGIAKSKLIETANPYQLSPEYDSGGAGLFATVDEYIKIITVIACGGTTKDGYVLLRPETIEMMKQNRLCDKALDDFAKYGYGWGLCCRTHMRPEQSFSLSPVGEMGWDGAAAAFVMIDTDNRIALYFGTHIKGCSFAYGKVHPELRNRLYEGLADN
jgi:CubicO group peptidase (beta-lactamase class C family)